MTTVSLNLPMPPVYQPPKIERSAPDPVRQKRGRNSRARGAKAERELVRLFERQGFTVITQSGPNRRDFLASSGDGQWSVECKSKTAAWPAPSEVKRGWAQAVRQAPRYAWPLLIFCLRHQGKPTTWRVYSPDGYEALDEWFLRILKVKV